MGWEAGGGVRDMVQLLLEDQLMGRADVIMTIRGLGYAGLQWQGLGFKVPGGLTACQTFAIIPQLPASLAFTANAAGLFGFGVPGGAAGGAGSMDHRAKVSHCRQ